MGRKRKKLSTLQAELGEREPAPDEAGHQPGPGAQPEPTREQRLADNDFVARWIAGLPTRYLPPPLNKAEEDILAKPIAELLVRYTTLDKIGAWAALAIACEMVYGPRLIAFNERKRLEAERGAAIDAGEAPSRGGVGLRQDAPVSPPAVA